jgi:hypothetical protein
MITVVIMDAAEEQLGEIVECGRHIARPARCW